MKIITKNNMRETLPYVMIEHTSSTTAFFLNRNYALMEDERLHSRAGSLRRFFRDNQSQSWVGWLPSFHSQTPDWAKPIYTDGGVDEFTAYWIKDHFDAEPKKVKELSAIMSLPDLPKGAAFPVKIRN